MPSLIYIISGFLGSGKTTFINNILLSTPPITKVVVLVNDFGSISIDGKLIKTDPCNIIDISGGCICCDMSFELISSVRFVLESLKPDIILIECTGLAIPQEVARQAVSPFFEGKAVLGGIITVIDAAGMDLDEYPFIAEQLKEADIVILNKVDLIDHEEIGLLREKIRGLVRSTAVLYETSFGKIEYGEIFSKTFDDAHIARGKTPGKIDTTAGFVTICIAGNAPLPIEKLVHLHEIYGDKILRSKGFILTEKGTVEFQFSIDGMDIKQFLKPVERTELVLIVREEDRDLIRDAFRTILTLERVM